MNWKVGDKIKINHTSPYRYAREGAIGTIIQILHVNLALIRFTKQENLHVPELIYGIHTEAWDRRTMAFTIDLTHCSSFDNHIDDFSQIIAKKIKEIDTKWAATQEKKGNKYALLLLQ